MNSKKVIKVSIITCIVLLLMYFVLPWIIVNIAPPHPNIFLLL